MLKLITKILLFILLSQGLYAGDGLSQKHLVSVSPEALAIGVSADTTIEIVFDTAIVVKSVKKNTIKLNNIKGTTTLVGESTLLFTADEALVSGEYEVNVKKVKLQNTQSGNTELKPKTGYEKFIYWLCSLFYDNPADCPLCKKICGNSNDSIKTKKIKYSFTVDDASPKIETITLSETSIELHEGNETTLTVTANYDDNTTQDISNDVEWVIGDASIVSVTNGIVKALKEGATTVQAKYEGKTSDTLNIVVYQEVNGYRLPPEPDPSVNNTTLLGIDSNDNGVRDDVERWIYITYKDKHPIHVDIAMQAGRAKQNMLKDPSKAKEIHDEMSAPIDCESYYRVCVKEPKKKIHIRERINSKLLRSIIFNTKKRKDAYMQYNSLLSGDTYVIPWCSERKQLCDFDTTKYEE